MISSTKLIEKFEKELKYRTEIKSKNRRTPDKVLLDSFKYYDIKNQGLANYQTFLQVVRVKLGINIFTDEQLTMVFDYYLGNLESTNNNILYRDLVSHLYNINVSLMGPSDNKSHFT